MQKFNLDIPHMGYILLVRHEKGWVGDCIKAEQINRGINIFDSQYTHVEIMGGGPHSIRVAPPFSKVIDITKVYKNRYVKIMRYKDLSYDLFERRRYKVAFWAASHCNLAYDWFGVLKFRIKWLFHLTKNYFCSENTSWALRKEGYNAFGKLKDNEVMPAHFLNEHFTLVWEGRIV